MSNAQLILLLSFFLQSTTSIASPAVGDFAKYKVRVMINGHVEFDGYETQTLKSFDPATQSFLKVSDNGGNFEIPQTGLRYIVTPHAERLVSIDSLSSDAYLKNLVSNCEKSFNGTLVQYKVADRVLQTCKQNIQGGNGVSGMAEVPFAWAFFHYLSDFGSVDQAEVDQELVSFGTGIQ